MTGPIHRLQQPSLSRRSLLRGAAVLAAATAATAGPAAAADAGPSATFTDHPGAQWLPAHPTNFRTAQRSGLGSRPVRHVVIHVTQDYFDDAVAVFQSPGPNASAHYVVRSDGHIGQCVREKDIAWHTDDSGSDSSSIGITHEGWVNSSTWFTDAMYASSAALTAAVCLRHSIPLDRTHIVGHSELPGTTHTDPGANWDWDRYLELVRKAGARRG